MQNQNIGSAPIRTTAIDHIRDPIPDRIPDPALDRTQEGIVLEGHIATLTTVRIIVIEWYCLFNSSVSTL